MNNETSVKTYLYHASTSSCGGTNATIQDYHQHGKAQTRRTNQDHRNQDHRQHHRVPTTNGNNTRKILLKNKNYEMFGGGVMLVERGTK